MSSLLSCIRCGEKKYDRTSRASNTSTLDDELTSSQEARKKGNKGKSKNKTKTTVAGEHQARLLTQDDRLRQDHQRALATLNDKENELKKYQSHYQQVLDENNRLKQELSQLDRLRQDHQRALATLNDKENELKKYQSHYHQVLVENNRLKQEQCDERHRFNECQEHMENELKKLRSTVKELSQSEKQHHYSQSLGDKSCRPFQDNGSPPGTSVPHRQQESYSSQEPVVKDGRKKSKKQQVKQIQPGEDDEQALLLGTQHRVTSDKVSRRISNIEDDESDNQKGKKKASKKKTEAKNEAEMNVMREQFTAFQREVADLQERISALTRDKETANMKYEEGKAIYTENIHNLRSTQAELTSTKEELTSSKAKLTSMLDKLTSTQAELTSTRAELTSTQVELTSIQVKLSSTQFKPTSTQDELTSTQDELASTLFANEKLELQLVQLQSEHEKLKLERKDLRKQVKERDHFLADVQNQFDDMKRSNEDSQTQLRQQYAAVEGLQNELFQKNRQIEQLQQDSTDNPTNEAGYQDKDDVIRQLNEEMSEFRDSMRRQLQVKDDENMALRLALENEERQTARRQDDCASVESLGSDLAKSKNRIKHLQADVSRLTNQLSKQMHQKLNEDESALENINSKNRPSKIVEDYQEMMTSEWLDAKDALDTMYPDETLEQMKIAFLTSVLMDAHNLAEEQLTLHKRHLRNILLNPINGAAEAGRGYTAEEEQGAASRAESVPISRDLVAALTAFIKDHSDTANVHHLAEMVMSRLKDKPQWNSIICNLEDDRALMEYVKSSCALVWRMVVQKPPLTLSTPDIGQPHTKDKHEVYFDCPKHPANVIVSYVAPIMVQNSKNLTKGKVFVAPRE